MNIINFATPKGGESFLQRYFLLQGLQKRYKELAQKGVNHSTKVFSFIQPFQGCEWMCYFFTTGFNDGYLYHVKYI